MGVDTQLYRHFTLSDLFTDHEITRVSEAVRKELPTTDPQVSLNVLITVLEEALNEGVVVKKDINRKLMLKKDFVSMVADTLQDSLDLNILESEGRRRISHRIYTKIISFVKQTGQPCK